MNYLEQNFNCMNTYYLGVSSYFNLTRLFHYSEEGLSSFPAIIVPNPYFNFKKCIYKIIRLLLITGYFLCIMISIWIPLLNSLTIFWVRWWLGRYSRVATSDPSVYSRWYTSRVGPRFTFAIVSAYEWRSKMAVESGATKDY